MLVERSYRVCPPIFEAGPAYEDVSASCQRRDYYWNTLRPSSTTLRVLWTAIAANVTVRRQKVYMDLIQTMMQIECVDLFSTCFAGGEVYALQLLVQLCAIFRSEVDEAFRLDQEFGYFSSPDERGESLPNLASEKRFQHHFCYAPNSEVLHWNDHVLLRNEAVSALWPVMDSTAALNRLTLPSRTSAASPHVFGDVCHRKDLLWFHEMPDIQLQYLLTPRKGLVINIGGGDGSCDFGAHVRDSVGRSFLEASDPANCLMLLGGRGGIIFEGNESFKDHLLEKFDGRSDIQLNFGRQSPSTLSALARDDFASKFTGVDEDLDLIKVDVDNCDCCFLEALLDAGFRPRMIHVEVNGVIPPPISFRPKSYNPDVTDPLIEMAVEYGRRGYMVHCSLSAFAELLEPFGYSLVALFFHDALFAHDALLPTLLTATDRDRSLESFWYGGFYCHPLRPANPQEVAKTRHFLYDYRQWNVVEISPTHRMQMIRTHLDMWQISNSTYHLSLYRPAW